jgi:hypothetical protein
MNKELMIKCFNEWMRRLIEEPNRFQEEADAISKFLKERHSGRTPSYGDDCAEHMFRLAGEIGE